LAGGVFDVEIAIRAIVPAQPNCSRKGLVVRSVYLHRLGGTWLSLWAGFYVLRFSKREALRERLGTAPACAVSVFCGSACCGLPYEGRLGRFEVAGVLIAKTSSGLGDERTHVRAHNKGKNCRSGLVVQRPVKSTRGLALGVQQEGRQSGRPRYSRACRVGRNSCIRLDAVWPKGSLGAKSRRNCHNEQEQQLSGRFPRALPDFRIEDNVGSPQCVRGYVADRHLGGPEFCCHCSLALCLRRHSYWDVCIIPPPRISETDLHDKISTGFFHCPHWVAARQCDRQRTTNQLRFFDHTGPA